MPPRGSGAGKEARTPDLNLGKVALYQLSYSRVRRRHFKPRLKTVKPTLSAPPDPCQAWPGGAQVDHHRPQRESGGQVQ